MTEWYNNQAYKVVQSPNLTPSMWDSNLGGNVVPSLSIFEKLKAGPIDVTLIPTSTQTGTYQDVGYNTLTSPAIVGRKYLTQETDTIHGHVPALSVFFESSMAGTAALPYAMGVYTEMLYNGGSVPGARAVAMRAVSKFNNPMTDAGGRNLNAICVDALYADTANHTSLPGSPTFAHYRCATVVNSTNVDFTTVYGLHISTLAPGTKQYSIYSAPVDAMLVHDGKARFGYEEDPIHTLDLGSGGNRTGTLGLYSASSTYATILQAGAATAGVTYTLPTAGPALSTGSFLSSNTSGTLSWSDSPQLKAGFENATNSTMSMTSSTFQIAPTSGSFSFYVSGVKYTATTTSTVSIANDNTQHYVYFNNSGTLIASTSAWVISDTASPCATVYRYGTNYAIQNERHLASRNIDMHRLMHDCYGAAYESGLSASFSNTTFSIAQGVVHDEDIEHDTGGAKTSCRMWHRQAGATAMAFASNVTTPYTSSSGTPNIAKYDNSGTLTNVDNNKYFHTWFYATNDIDYPIYAVVGQNQYNTVALADAAPIPTIPGLTTREWRLLYRARYQQNPSTGPVYISATDYRTANLGPGQAFANSGSHMALTDRDVANSHPQAAITGLTTADVPVFAGVNFDHATSTYSTIIVAGSASASVTYTLPASAPSTNSSALTCQTSGALAWETITASGGYTEGARVHTEARFTMSTAIWTPITYAAVRYDTNTFFTSAAPTKLTINTTGKYCIGGTIEYNTVAACNRYVAIMLSGSVYISTQGINIAGYWETVTSTVHNLTAGDYVELYVYQDSGANLALLHGNNYSAEFYAQRIG